MKWIYLMLSVSLCSSQMSELTLINDVLYKREYSNQIRPLINQSENVLVTVQGTMKKLHDVDETRGEITTVMWLKMSWFDEHMAFENVLNDANKTVRMPKEKLWKPDVTVLNCITGCDFRPHDSLVLEPNGLVSMLASVTVTTACHFYYRWFPFDSHRCDLTLGSLSYDMTQLDLDLDEVVRLDEFRWDVKWEVTDVTIKRQIENITDPRTNETMSYPKIVMSVYFYRLPLPYVLGFLLPCMIFCSIILLQFLLSPEDRERLVLSIGILMVVALYGLFITGFGSTPWQANSILGAYYICILCGATASLAISILVVNMFFTRYTQKRMKDKVQKFMLYWLPKILLIEPLPEHKWRRKSMFRTTIRPNAPGSQARSAFGTDDGSRNAGASGARDETPLLDLNKQRAERLKVTLGDMDKSGDEVNPMSEELKITVAWTELIKTVREILFRVDKQLADQRSEEWKFAANVVDRAGLILISLYMLIVHIVLFIPMM